MLNGCPAIDSPANPGGTQGPVVLFEEDDDPAMAALPFVEDELLVQPFPGTSQRELSLLFDRAGATEVETLPEIDMTVLRIDPTDHVAIAAALIESGLIETVQKNYLFDPQQAPNDPFYASQWHLESIHAPAAWDITTGSNAVRIAIVDTGLDADHPDLTARVVDGWNVHDANADYSDPVGHGTSSAGTAAAGTNNNIGVAGVAWSNPIVAVRVGDENGRAGSSHLAAGILWAVGRGAKVINVSYAPLWSNRVVRSAAQSALNRGSLVVISAGNGGGETRSRGFDEALFVGAIDGFGRIASFSDKGPFVDLVAPGVGIYSTRLGDSFAPVTGTSFAAPIVSGVAALAWSTNPDLRPSVIRSAIIRSALDLGPSGEDDAYGVGLVDAAGAVQRAIDSGDVRDVDQPVVSIEQPRDGTTITRRTTVNITASDNESVVDVVMFVDGLAVATDTRAPYRFTLDPTAHLPGRHVLSFIASDPSGNASDPSEVSVTLNPSVDAANATKIEFVSPSSDSTVTNDVTIHASISDPDGLAVVEWFVDEASVLVIPVSGESTGITYRWRTADYEPGPHSISIIATDKLGGRTTGSIELILN